MASKPAFEAIFDAHAAYVGRALRHLGVGEADLEDVTQEVFLTVHRRLAEFDGRGNVRTWIYRIAWNLAANHRRHRTVRERRSATLDDAGVPASQEVDLARARSRARLGALLDQLDDAQRTTFVLYEIEQLPMREVAAILGCPLQTAYSRLSAARSKLVAAAEAAGWRDSSDD